jgi:hypothetical protein
MAFPSVSSPYQSTSPLFGARNRSLSQEAVTTSVRQVLGQDASVLQLSMNTFQVLDGDAAGTSVQRFEQMCRQLETLPDLTPDQGASYGRYLAQRSTFSESGNTVATQQQVAASRHPGAYSYRGVKLWVFPPREFFQGGIA